MAGKPLDGVLVVALEQAVAGPFCSSRLADAGARIIKIERPDGDCARGYDRAVYGESSCFVWTNRGKESLALDLNGEAGQLRLHSLIGAADVFIQNLAPGVASQLGFDAIALRSAHPRLITCDISSYGGSGPLHSFGADDLLVQAESGLFALGGAARRRAGIGLPICDIAAGMNALIGIQQALLQRQRTGAGSGIEVSLFDSAADLMAVPCLQAQYGGSASGKVWPADPGIESWGPFTCADGKELLLSISSEREWAGFCDLFLLDAMLATDPRFAGRAARAANREPLESLIQGLLSDLNHGAAIDRLTEAQTAFGTINSVYDMIDHPQRRTRAMPVNGRAVQLPATPYVTEWDDPTYRPLPRIDQHLELPGS